MLIYTKNILKPDTKSTGVIEVIRIGDNKYIYTPNQKRPILSCGKRSRLSNKYLGMASEGIEYKWGYHVWIGLEDIIDSPEYTEADFEDSLRELEYRLVFGPKYDWRYLLVEYTDYHEYGVSDFGMYLMKTIVAQNIYVKQEIEYDEAYNILINGIIYMVTKNQIKNK